MALQFIIPAGITLVRLATGQLVKYGSKKAADSAVKNPPQNISTKVTIGDQPFKTAILVKLYVPYATKPNMKPV